MIQYIRNKQNQKIGLLYAEKSNGEIHVGYSLLNPLDALEVAEYNHKVKRVNAASYQLKNTGIEAPIESYKPAFDKEMALSVAKNRASNIIKINDIPHKAMNKVLQFIPVAVRHLKGKIVIE